MAAGTVDMGAEIKRLPLSQDLLQYYRDRLGALRDPTRPSVPPSSTGDTPTLFRRAHFLSKKVPAIGEPVRHVGSAPAF